VGQGAQGNGGQGQPAASPRDRRAEVEGPQRLRRRGGHEDDRGDRALTRHRGVGLMPQARGKKYKEAAKAIQRTEPYGPDDAVRLVLKSSTSKFDGSIEVHLRLGVDPRHADQMVRGSVVLPHGTGKKRRV